MTTGDLTHQANLVRLGDLGRKRPSGREPSPHAGETKLAVPEARDIRVITFAACGAAPADVSCSPATCSGAASEESGPRLVSDSPLDRERIVPA